MMKQIVLKKMQHLKIIAFLILGIFRPGFATEVAPYFYTWGYNSSGYAVKSLTESKQLANLDSVILAFELSGGGCTLSSDVDDMLSDVKSYIAAGGRLILSFGGADGPYLEDACTDVSQIVSLITGLMQRTGTYNLDFDIEGSYVANNALNSRRIQALAQLQNTFPQLYISYTLPVDAKIGLDSNALNLLSQTLAGGVNINIVNIMTMDYGYTVSGKTMGDLAIESSEITVSQLKNIYTNKSTAEIYAMIGLTPMIGTNDDNSVFTIADAHQIATYATQNKIGLISYWAFQRDQTGSGSIDIYSNVNTSNFQFYDLFKSACSGPTPNPPTPTPPGPTPSPTPRPRPTPPSPGPGPTPRPPRPTHTPHPGPTPEPTPAPTPSNCISVDLSSTGNRHNTTVTLQLANICAQGVDLQNSVVMFQNTSALNNIIAGGRFGPISQPNRPMNLSSVMISKGLYEVSIPLHFSTGARANSVLPPNHSVTISFNPQQANYVPGSGTIVLSGSNPPTPTPTPTPTPNPTPTPTPITGGWGGTHIPFQLPGGLTATQADTILSLVSIAENSTTSWWQNYTYIEDIGDGRGYTINIVGFCTGTGDFLWLVQDLQKINPNHPLVAYLPALEQVNGTASHAGLTGLPALIATLGNDQDYLQATWDAVIHFYWSTAMDTAAQYGLVDPISKGQLYDIALNAGDLSIVNKVTATAPINGGDEKTWLAALQALWLIEITVGDHSIDDGQPDRALMWQSILNKGNVTLARPLTGLVCYGDTYTIN